jgi:putative phosphoribosyl transferase
VDTVGLMPTGLDPTAVEVWTGEVALDGDLTVPQGAAGLVVFAHGSGSSRFSPRNRLVARALVEAGLATLLFDLLTPEEEEQEQLASRFDIEMLARRLAGATRYVRGHAETHRLRVGYFGASTGAAAALVAAAELPDVVEAVVSRGGRPDLAGEALEHVEAPTLLIVGSGDHPVVELNARALQRLHCEKRMEIVVGATHVFEEPGALEEVARLARDWFVHHLVEAPRPLGRLQAPDASASP